MKLEEKGSYIDKEQIMWARKLVRQNFQKDSSCLHQAETLSVHSYRLHQQQITSRRMPIILSAICQHEEQLEEKKALLRLRFYSNDFGFQGCKHLSTTNWNSLEALDLGKCSIGPRGCKHLSKGKWPNLRFLVLDGNDICNLGCQYLIRAQWPNLQELDLQGNMITQQGCEKLAGASWPKLNELILYNNRMGKAGCHYLRSHRNWQVLCQFQFRRES